MGRKKKRKKKEQGRKAFEEYERRKQKIAEKKATDEKRKRKIMVIGGILLLILVAGFSYAIYTPGKYDAFAKCLSEKGAIMYGEDWCQFTNAQKSMFGKSFKYINYEVKTGLDVRPTWVINGKEYKTVQSFQRLAELTNCSLGG